MDEVVGEATASVAGKLRLRLGVLLASAVVFGIVRFRMQRRVRV